MLVNNVGTNKRGEAVDYSAEDFESLIGVNLQSAFGLAQLCHGMLKAAQGGAVIFNTSVAGGPLAMTSTTIYGMAKGAVLVCPLQRGHLCYAVTKVLCVVHMGKLPRTRYEPLALQRH